MDLVKAWAVAVLAYVLSLVLFGIAVASAADPRQLTTGAAHYLWSLIPSLATYLLLALLAAIFHGKGHGAGRHALAVLAVPAVTLVISVVGSAVAGTPSLGTTVLSVVAAIIGTVAGWRLVDRLRKEKTTASYW